MPQSSSSSRPRPGSRSRSLPLPGVCYRRARRGAAERKHTAQSRFIIAPARGHIASVVAPVLALELYREFSPTLQSLVELFCRSRCRVFML